MDNEKVAVDVVSIDRAYMVELVHDLTHTAQLLEDIALDKRDGDNRVGYKTIDMYAALLTNIVQTAQRRYLT